MSQGLTITCSDLNLRRQLAESLMEEAAVAYWLEHMSGCSALWGGSCDCGKVAWFWGARKVAGIDATLAVQTQLVQ